MSDATTDRRQGPGLAPLALCPSWCIEEAGEDHGPTHTSRSYGVSAYLHAASTTVWAEAVKLALLLEEDQAPIYLQLVTEDEREYGMRPSEARSLAAALTRLADIAEELV